MYQVPCAKFHKSQYFFYDFNFKVNYDLTKKDRIFLSLYYGQDAFKYTLNQTINFNWGNKVANMRWNHIFNSKLFMNTAFFISDYRYEISQKLPTYSFNLGSFITDYSVKSDFEYFKKVALKNYIYNEEKLTYDFYNNKISLIFIVDALDEHVYGA